MSYCLQVAQPTQSVARWFRLLAHIGQSFRNSLPFDSKLSSLLSRAGSPVRSRNLRPQVDAHACQMARQSESIRWFSADIFSIGCVIYMMTFGTCPILSEAESPAEILANWEAFFEHASESLASAEQVLQQIILGCLHQDPAQRPSSKEIMKSPYFESLSGELSFFIEKCRGG